MNPFASFFRRRSMAPAWTFAPGGVIWRIVPSTEGFIVGEDRYEKEKKVLFFCIELSTGRVLWSGRPLSETWWVGVEAIHRGSVFLHLFARPDLPGHTGVIALDILTGAERWSNRQIEFKGVHEGKVKGRVPGELEDRLVYLDAEDGSLIGDAPPDDHPERSSDGEGDTLDGIRYPTPLTEPLSRHDPRWSAFGFGGKTGELVGEVETIRVDERAIFCYHTAPPGQTSTRLLQHRLIIVDLSGRMLCADLLHGGAHMPVYDSFFVLNQRLYYVRNERELVCLDLSASD